MRVRTGNVQKKKSEQTLQRVDSLIVVDGKGATNGEAIRLIGRIGVVGTVLSLGRGSTRAFGV
jgi:hypothetical protein